MSTTATKKKSKYATGKPFTTEVSDAIRHHVGSRKALESRRLAAFDDKAAAVAELAEMDDEHSKEGLKVKERHSDAVILIDTLAKKIAWHNGQADKLTEDPDAPEFEFMYEMPEDDEEDVQQKLRPAAAKEKQGKPAAADVHEGEDQHLAASCNELDLREDIKGKLGKAFGNIQSMVRFVDAGGDLSGEAVNLSDAEKKAAHKALNAFRAAHRQAARAVEEPVKGPRLARG